MWKWLVVAWAAVGLTTFSSAGVTSSYDWALLAEIEDENSISRGEIVEVSLPLVTKLSAHLIRQRGIFPQQNQDCKAITDAFKWSEDIPFVNSLLRLTGIVVLAPVLILVGAVDAAAVLFGRTEVLVNFLALVEECLNTQRLLYRSAQGGPLEAIARFSGEISGKIRFTETYDDNGDVVSVILLGKFDGLKPGNYRLKVHESGDISESCGNIGAVKMSLIGNYDFSPAADGSMVLLLRELKLTLDEVLGRALVLTAGSQPPVCAPIVRI